MMEEKINLLLNGRKINKEGIAVTIAWFHQCMREGKTEKHFLSILKDCGISLHRSTLWRWNEVIKKNFHWDTLPERRGRKRTLSEEQDEILLVCYF